MKELIQLKDNSVYKFFVYRKSSQLGIGELMNMEKIYNIIFNEQTMKLIKRLGAVMPYGTVKNQA